MNKTTLIVSGVVLATAGVVGYRYYAVAGRFDPAAKYELAVVQKGTLVQEAQASGKVAPPTTVDLQFKNSGKLTAVKATVGASVKTGQLLAKQDTAVLDAQWAETRANLDAQQAKLKQLQAGASPEDVALAATAVANARQSLTDAQQNLVDKLQDAYTKADDAVRNKTDQFFADPQTANPQISFSVIDSQLETDLEWERSLLNSLLPAWQTAADSLIITSDLTRSLTESKRNLEQTRSFLDKAALAVNNPSNKPNSVSSTTWEGWKSDVSTARTNINTALANLSAAAEKLRASEAVLKTAEDQLTLKKAPARAADLALAEAQIRQAEAQQQKIQAQIREMVLIAPVSGTVTEVNGSVGETIKSDAVVVRLIPLDALQIDVNISEADIVGIKVGQETRITLDAFGDEASWPGLVSRIDPAETVVGGAIYYKTTVLFVDQDERIKPGMTANVWIKYASQENALYLPLEAVKEKRGQEPTDSRLYAYVEVWEGNQIKEKEVRTGQKGAGGIIEILSGLRESEKIILGTKKQ